MKKRVLNQIGIMLVTCLLILLSCQVTIAATYYVDSVAGIDTNSGTSSATPWKYAPGMPDFTGRYYHSAGDVFVFKGGVMWAASGSDGSVMTIGYSGAEGNPDIYMGGQRCGQSGSVSCNDGKAWGSGYPVFDGGALNGMKGIYASQKNYITLDGFKIQNVGYTDGSGQAILFGGGSGITVQNCLLEPNGVNAFAYAASSGTYSAVYFHDNIIKKAGRVHFTAGDSRVTDVRYYNNTQYGAYDYNAVTYHNDGLMIGGDGVLDYAIQGLYIHDNKWVGNWSKGATAQIYLNGTPMYCYDYINGSHQPTINTVAVGQTSAIPTKIYSVTNAGGWTGAGTGTICGSGNALMNGENLNETSTYGGQFIGKIASSSKYSSLKGTKDVYIYNNLLVTENASGATLSPGAIDISAGHSDVKIYNNTIDMRSNTAIPMSHCVFLGAFVNNIDIQNNILAGCDNGVTLSTTTSGAVTIDNNLFYTLGGNHLIWDSRIATRYNTCAQIQTAGFGKTYCSIAEPKFVKLPANGVIDSGNWNLQPDSPAVDDGADLSSTLFATDIVGNDRTGSWDIGAYEFKLPQSTLLVTSVNGTVTSNPAGINCGSTCAADYDDKASVTLTATPNSGYTFTGWSGSGCSGTGTCTVSMTGAMYVTASFARTMYNLTVGKSGAGSGTITGSDGLINCGSTCSVNYESGTAVNLTATPASGSVFTGWSGACSGMGACAVTMDAAKSITANFIPVYTLTVIKSLAAAGTVTGSDGLINCGSTCQATYPPAASVTLTTLPVSGYTFTGWMGSGCSGTGSCSVSLSASTSVTATFAMTVYNLTVTKSGTGSGSVTGSDGLINCGSTCSVNYESGKTVTLSATPVSGSTFSGWSGACTGTGACTVTMTQAKSVGATFTKNVLYNLTVTKSGTGTGTVASSPAGINCGSTCTAAYSSGASVTLTTTPASGSVFSGWSGACTGTGACTVSMTQAKSVTATFTKTAVYKLTVKNSLAKAGTITSSPAGINCGSTCSANYSSGTSVTLTASANSGYRFYKWSGACYGSSTCVVSMTAAKSVSAYYLPSK